MAAQLCLQPRGFCRGPETPSAFPASVLLGTQALLLSSAVCSKPEPFRATQLWYFIPIEYPASLITFKSSLGPQGFPDQSQVWPTEGKKSKRLCLIFFSPQECRWICFQLTLKHLYVPLPREAGKINPGLKARRKWAWQTHSDLGTPFPGLLFAKPWLPDQFLAPLNKPTELSQHLQPDKTTWGTVFNEVDSCA